MSKKIKIAKRHTQLPMPHFARAMEEIENQTDRGAAIAGTAFLDLLIRHAIEKRMRYDPDLQDRLFENRGPLQDFSARFQLAFALKFIGSGAYMDLCILRDIRNAFAHSVEPLSFDRDDIAEKCKSLWFPRKILYENERTPPETARALSIRAVKLIADGLIEAEARAGRIPIPDTFIQLGPPWPPYQPSPSSPKKPKVRFSRDHPIPSKKTDQ
jgi:Mannitol repressor